MIDPKWHGTSNGYGNLGCRCNPCREAHRQKCIGFRRRRHSQRVLLDGVLFHPDAPHGTYSAYSNYGCRCDLCTAAWRDYYAGLTKRRRSA